MATPDPAPPSTPVEMDIARSNFPDDFVFGVATAAYQVEGAYMQGGRGLSIWDVYANGYPANILDGSNGNIAVDMYNRYKDDIRTMRIMGFDAYRFSISWSRIIPSGKISLGINQEGIDYYNDLINTIIENGMKPYVTLFHWDLPFVLEREYGGFMSSNIVNDFRDYAELCFWEFGDRVKHWITINEAWTYAAHGYASRYFPPGNGFFGPESDADREAAARAAEEPLTEDRGQCFIPYRGDRIAKEVTVVRKSRSIVIRRLVPPCKTNDPSRDREAYTVAANILLSHGTAVDSYRRRFQTLQNGKIGMTNNIHWFVPYTDTEEDRQAARRGFDFMLGWFLEPVLTGQYPASMLEYAKENITPFTPEESKLLKGSSDFLGINHYTTWYAANEPNPDPEVEGYNRDQRIRYFQIRDDIPIGESTGSSWLYIVPWGFYQLFEFLNNTFNKDGDLPPIYITENGCDQPNNPQITHFEACNDGQRVGYFHEYLSNLRKAMTDFNIKVESYFAWSYCDNFEWYDGYNSRFGILFVDFKNKLQRYRKDSAMWFTKFLLK